MAMSCLLTVEHLTAQTEIQLPLEIQANNENYILPISLFTQYAITDSLY